MGEFEEDFLDTMLTAPLEEALAYLLDIRADYHRAQAELEDDVFGECNRLTAQASASLSGDACMCAACIDEPIGRC
jgi:hypothetical protein